jgi:hypothetical protein
VPVSLEFLPAFYTDLHKRTVATGQEEDEEAEEDELADQEA